MNPTPFFPDDELLAQSLRQLQPNNTPLDPAIVFYRMGLEAGRKQQTRAVLPAVAALLLAASLSAAVVGPVGYRLGQAAGGWSDPSAPGGAPIPASEPMLAHSEPMRSVEHDASEAADLEHAEVAHTRALPPTAASTPAMPEQPAGPPSPDWSPVHAAMVNWLWGDLLDGPPSGHGSTLTRRLTLGADDWFTDGAHSPHTGFTHSSSAPPDPNRDVSASNTRPARRGALRASDWKEIVENKNPIY